MLDQLLNIIPQVIDSLDSKDGWKEWDSLIINRRKPHTYRMFRKFGDLRVCLHKFEPCEAEDAFAHPHPWPGAFLVLRGQYIQNIGYSESLESDPVFFYKEVVRANTMYEIVNPKTWHSVQPLETTYTIMVNGEPWEEQHSQTRTTKGKDLEKMNNHDLIKHLLTFSCYLSQYKANRINKQETRKIFQRDKPSLQELVDSGEYSEPVTQEEYLQKKVDEKES